MEKLFALHDEYLALVPMAFTRGLMDKIDWNSRLIAIKGQKGVGKSTLMQQFIKKQFAPGDRHVLYCSADTGTFEGGTYPLPHDYDFCLRFRYGDHMQLPPGRRKVLA